MKSFSVNIKLLTGTIIEQMIDEFDFSLLDELQLISLGFADVKFRGLIYNRKDIFGCGFGLRYAWNVGRLSPNAHIDKQEQISSRKHFHWIYFKDSNEKFDAHDEDKADVEGATRRTQSVIESNLVLLLNEVL